MIAAGATGYELDAHSSGARPGWRQPMPSRRCVDSVRGSSCRPLAAGPCEVKSHHARTTHEGFRFVADLAGNLEGIALLELRQEELDREWTGISLVRELAKNRGQRRDSVARDEPGGVVQQLPRHVGHILKVHVANFP